ncbi:hypothetical protein LTR08_007386 [Meristemomyces frigidus]|nr:hypothetical protein LTR08_007386 [Meristemomyces frigidus]
MLDTATPTLSTPWPFLAATILTSLLLNTLYCLLSPYNLSPKIRHRTIALFAWSAEAIQLTIALIGTLTTISSAVHLTSLSRTHDLTALETFTLICIFAARTSSTYVLALYATHWTEMLLYPNHALARAKLVPFMLTRAVLRLAWKGRAPRAAKIYVLEGAPLPPMPKGWWDRDMKSGGEMVAVEGAEHPSDLTSAALLSNPANVQPSNSSTIPSTSKKTNRVSFAETTPTPIGTGTTNFTRTTHEEEPPLPTSPSVSLSQPTGSLPPTPDSKTGFVKRRVEMLSKPVAAVARKLEWT